jgi:DNA-binding NarL/FixJ family response regulator
MAVQFVGGEVINERPLTPAHLRVAAGLVRGLSNKRIAAELEISPKTVHDHIREMCARVGVGSSRALIVFLVSDRDLTSGR